MLYKQLGKSTLEISRIGFGCMSLKPGQKDIEAIINAAIKSGINFFDTSDLYDKGLNEQEVGKAIKQQRPNIILATKVGNRWRPDGSGWDWVPSKQYIFKAIDESLLRLQTDYIDLYQLHGGTMEDPIDEIIEAFEVLQEKGKIRHYGISSIRPNVIREYVQRSNIVSVMMQYSLLDRRPEESCLPLLLQKNIGVLARGSVASGLLINKPVKPFLQYSAEEVKLMQEKITETAAENNIDESQTALQFVLNHPAITAAIVGIRTHKHLEDAVAALQVPAMNDLALASLKMVLPMNTYAEHR